MRRQQADSQPANERGLVAEQRCMHSSTVGLPAPPRDCSVPSPCSGGAGDRPLPALPHLHHRQPLPPAGGRSAGRGSAAQRSAARSMGAFPAAPARGAHWPCASWPPGLGAFFGLFFFPPRPLLPAATAPLRPGQQTGGRNCTKTHQNRNKTAPPKPSSILTTPILQILHPRPHTRARRPPPPQAFRHLYVMAAQPRSVDAVDVDSHAPVYVPLEITLAPPPTPPLGPGPGAAGAAGAAGAVAAGAGPAAAAGAGAGSAAAPPSALGRLQPVVSVNKVGGLQAGGCFAMIENMAFPPPAQSAGAGWCARRGARPHGSHLGSSDSCPPNGRFRGTCLAPPPQLFRHKHFTSLHFHLAPLCRARATCWPSTRRRPRRAPAPRAQSALSAWHPACCPSRTRCSGMAVGAWPQQRLCAASSRPSSPCASIVPCRLAVLEDRIYYMNGLE